MKRLALSLFLLLCFVGGYSAAPAYADCLGPNPTATPQPTYADKVLATGSGHLLAYWQLNETSGTTAADSSGNGRAGAYSGATLAGTTFIDGSPAPSFDGINDYINIYSSSLASAFNSTRGSLLVWLKVQSSATLIDATTRRGVHISSDTNNRIGPVKSSSSNVFAWAYIAGGVNKNISKTSFTDVGWFAVLETWDKTADQFIAYYDGAEEGTPQTGLGTWSGALASDRVVIGAQTTAMGDQVWSGYIAHVALWDIALSSGDAANLAIVPSISPTATPYPTCTPSPTGSPSPTPTPTPSNTLDLIMRWTLPAPATTGTPEPGQPVSFAWSLSAGQAAVAIELAILIFSVIAISVIWLLIRGRS